MKKDFLIRALLGAIIGLAICITLYAFGMFDEIIVDNKGFMIGQFIAQHSLALLQWAVPLSMMWSAGV